MTKRVALHMWGQCFALDYGLYVQFVRLVKKAAHCVVKVIHQNRVFTNCTLKCT